LGNLSRACENLLAAAVGRLYADNNVAVAHADVAKLDLKTVTRNDHPDEVDIITIKRKMSNVN